ncbi:unnamed protein product [Eretmochelys imbricata]
MGGTRPGFAFARQIRRHPGLIPLISFIGLGLGSAALYLLRLALCSPDVSGVSVPRRGRAQLPAQRGPALGRGPLGAALTQIRKSSNRGLKTSGAEKPPASDPCPMLQRKAKNLQGLIQSALEENSFRTRMMAN